MIVLFCRFLLVYQSHSCQKMALRGIQPKVLLLGVHSVSVDTYYYYYVVLTWEYVLFDWQHNKNVV